MTRIKRNGFTLLGSIVAMMISSFVFLLLLNVGLLLNTSSLAGKVSQKHMWMFFTQIKKDIHMAQSSTCNQNGLTLNVNGRVVNYALNGVDIRRQVNGKGYEIVLQNILSFAVQCQESLIKLTITNSEGRRYIWNVVGYALR